MNRKRYLDCLRRLELTQEEAGPVFGVSSRTAQRWAKSGPPPAVSAVLILIDGDRHKLEVLMKQAGAR